MFCTQAGLRIAICTQSLFTVGRQGYTSLAESQRRLSLHPDKPRPWCGLAAACREKVLTLQSSWRLLGSWMNFQCKSRAFWNEPESLTPTFSTEPSQNHLHKATSKVFRHVCTGRTTFTSSHRTDHLHKSHRKSFWSSRNQVQTCIGTINFNLLVPSDFFCMHCFQCIQTGVRIFMC